MALPPVAIAAKAALATDKRAWKTIAVILATALTPIFIIVIAILGIGGGAAHHNNAALNLTFNGGEIPASMPDEYMVYILEMRACFAALEGAVESIGSEAEWDGVLDMTRAKSVFYALFFGDSNLRLQASEARAFVDLFARYETRTRPCTSSDCHDEYEDCEEEYTAAIPITDLPTAYANVGAHIDRALTPEDMANINEIYLRVTRGDFSVGFGSVSLTGGANGTHALIRDLTAGDDSPGPDSFGSPIRGDWRSAISAEFGDAGYPGHTGLDLAIPVRTEILAVADGVVLFTRASSTGMESTLPSITAAGW